jgi:signal transduction histidine kinase
VTPKAPPMASFSPSTQASPGLTGRVREAPAAWSFIAVGAVAVGVYFLLPSHSKGQSIYYDVLGLSAVGAVYVGTLRNLPKGERLAWHLFSVGLLGEVAGDAVWTVYQVQLNRDPPLPSIADAFYLGGYPLLAAGVFLILRRLGTQTSRAAVLDTVVIFCGVVLVQWVFFIDPYNHKHFGTEGARLVSMAYPAMDTLLLVALAQLLVGPGGRTVAYRMLLASVGLWVVADEIYGLNTASYQGGDWLDALWLLSYVIWGAAALEPSMARMAEPDRRRLPRLTNTRLILLAAALLTAPAILLIERARHDSVHSVAVGLGGAALACLVLLRLGGLVRAVEKAGRAERVARRESEQAQRLLTYQNEQLLELDTLKDEFVSSVSHELRTPLTSISGYVDLMLEDEHDAQKRGYLGIVERNAERLLKLVSDLLFSAQLQGGRLDFERTEVDLHRLVLQSVESARPRAEAAGIELVLDAQSVPPVAGEPVRLGQLLDNLVSNAIKFTPGGGRVDVHLSLRDGLVRFEISDTGIGIAELERERLFERFFRSQTALDRQIQGTGLGLYISKAIVEAHGGRIGVHSEPGEGTTFVVELPAIS